MRSCFFAGLGTHSNKGLLLVLPPKGFYDRRHSGPDQCYTDDPHDLQILQYFSKNDFSVHKGERSNSTRTMKNPSNQNAAKLFHICLN